jgi:hypothetical protein
MTDQFTTIMNDEDYRNCFMKYGALYGFIMAICIILYYASTDASVLTSRKYLYSMMTIIPLIAILAYVIPYRNSFGDNSLLLIFSIGLAITFIGALIYFYTKATSPTVIFLSYILNTILFLGVIAALAIFFYLFSNYLKSSTGIMGILVYFIFYIPCMFIDFAKFIIQEFKMTTNVVYILFILEIVLILLYIYVPQLLKYLIQSDNTLLLADSRFLDKERIISNNDPTKMTVAEKKKLGINNPSNENTVMFRREYCISMWVYLNSQPSNFTGYAKEVPIFCYGDSNHDTGKPRIAYFNKSNQDSDKLIIYFTDSTEIPTRYEYTIPKQKWVNIVLNYVLNKADLFINGNLERTVIFDNNEPDYSARDKFYIGSNNGLDGAICNIKYYNKPQTKTQIVANYNLLMNKNPPLQTM